MPPKKTILIEPADVLTAIVSAFDGDLQTLDAEIATLRASYAVGRDYNTFCQLARLDRHRGEIAALGILSDLPRFIGHPLTASERIIAQRCIRSLEAAGHVERCTRRIKPTDAGREALNTSEVADG